ncbi:L-arabinose ABC transporter ATP-binding protein AraG [Trinickia caryophylli]|uniref:L-arabinose ABC transporter ATP-binding protein n=1 Tax=Trinickia caryophylli TaxID=28094 RepID=A0A1X7D188_TRICW|nr:L-arabinose ABC transporter ATP-binding protein AraG [Trinickia caryophylli]PMS13570.1 L-arabinose ABC transporter ATP-binding protein AraG [Trinickia caryophylli]TRX15262.1 L-arabinose ABC transporter ATP-binding protein AraG [Trinickia caryophylli]WQE15137.1 L-arabinose ABC transporter ATP-binding protein AraG [Trinickia caryophylli]SMF06798.1 L-arabinose ABC transporter ATP-binding protein [Trinickia caryophylli]GLU31126.1 L-arabinose ABC transporter ATP-binding protein AraG [Trinickia c
MLNANDLAVAEGPGGARAPQGDAPYLELDGITVAFPGVLALDRVSLNVRAGEVHGLMGENGAGKSTLLKVLSGVNVPQAGTLRLGGVEQRFAGTKAAIDAGIAIIYQELHLVPELTVAENLMLGQLPSRGGVLDERTLVARASETLAQLGERIDPNTPVKELSIGQRQMIEIGKALMRNARVIAFDEPTSSLSSRETTQLFKIINALRAEGRAIVYVTHRMDEVYELCDRVTVFRDGHSIETFESMDGLERDRLISCMVGRSIRDVYGYRPRTAGDVHIEAKGLMGPGLSEPASFSARRGEIVGFFGLVGAGRSELMKLVCGAVRPTEGHVELDGRAVTFSSPRDAVRAGIALCPEDRKQDGIVAIASVADNLNISARRHFSPARFLLNERRERALTDDYIAKLSIKTRNGDTPIGTLSGGNQQKVILSRWLAEKIEVFVMDEPTRGIDVGARAQIYELLYGLAESGRTVLMVSSDLAEVIGVADRIVVMKEGRLVGDLPKADATPDQLIKLALPQ